MKLGIQRMAIFSLVRKNWLETQMRNHINDARVHQYAQEKKDGARFPPAMVYIGKDGVFWVGDGFHRILADKMNGTKDTEIILKRGEKKEAILNNIQFNAAQRGMPFTTADKYKCFERIMADEQWSKWPGTKIAHTLGVSTHTINLWVIKYEERNGNKRRTVTIEQQNGVVYTRALPDRQHHREMLAARKTSNVTSIVECIGEGFSPKEIAGSLRLNPGEVNKLVDAAEKRGLCVKCSKCNGTGFLVKGS